jgi:hypothetical protein
MSTNSVIDELRHQLESYVLGSDEFYAATEFLLWQFSIDLDEGSIESERYYKCEDELANYMFLQVLRYDMNLTHEGK